MPASQSAMPVTAREEFSAARDESLPAWLVEQPETGTSAARNSSAVFLAQLRQLVSDVAGLPAAGLIAWASPRRARPVARLHAFDRLSCAAPPLPAAQYQRSLRAREMAATHTHGALDPCPVLGEAEESWDLLPSSSLGDEGSPGVSRCPRVLLWSWAPPPSHAQAHPAPAACPPALHHAPGYPGCTSRHRCWAQGSSKLGRAPVDRRPVSRSNRALSSASAGPFSRQARSMGPGGGQPSAVPMDQPPACSFLTPGACRAACGLCAAAAPLAVPTPSAATPPHPPRLAPAHARTPASGAQVSA